MKLMVITSSPNQNGLTAACGVAAKAGAEEAGAEVVEVSLNRLDINTCLACSNGWGVCLKSHNCEGVKDDFQALHSAMATCDAFVFVTPVYWGEMSESAKSFFDRLRRCEAWKESNGFLQDKPAICVAAAGGSGNGVVSCLTIMEKLMMHTKTKRYDFIGITQSSKEYKLETIKAASRTMMSSLNK